MTTSFKHSTKCILLNMVISVCWIQPKCKDVVFALQTTHFVRSLLYWMFVTMPSLPLICTLNSHVIVGEKFNVELINVGHSNCLVRLESMWVQDLMSSPHSHGGHLSKQVWVYVSAEKGVLIWIFPYYVRIFYTNYDLKLCTSMEHL